MNRICRKPSVTTWNDGRSQTTMYHTYDQIRKDIPKLLSEHDQVEVTRSRRGEWGEWFERWELIEGKPTITKQTWL